MNASPAGHESKSPAAHESKSSAAHDSKATRRAPPKAVAAVGVDRSSVPMIMSLQRLAGNRAAVALLRRAGAPVLPHGKRVLARRRVPSGSELERILFVPGGAGLVDATDAAEHRAGLERLIKMSRSEMTNQQRARVDTERKRGLTAAQWAALSASEKDLREAEAIVRVRRDALLGDPLLINTGPRPGTLDAAHMTKLVGGANAILDRIATGAVDMHIGQVFGAANVAAAKAKYAKARTTLNALHASGAIVTDRSRYNAEAGLGGLTGASRISLAPDVIDNPTHRESIVTCIHESMNAGNDDVKDEGGYIDRREEFVRVREATTLTNAAHYEVVPRRMLGMGNDGYAYNGVTFTPGLLAPAPGPAPTPAAPVALPAAPAAPPPGPVVSLKQQAIDAAYLRWKDAWNNALNLHNLFVRNLRTPTDWTRDISAELRLAPGARFADVLPFWSRVEGLTIHKRPGIDPASADPSTQPVTQIDVALSEALVRQLTRGRLAAPETEAAATVLESAATPAERAAATTVEAERDLLIKLTARDIGTVTGDPDRDVHVVNLMGDKFLDWPEMLISWVQAKRVLSSARVERCSRWKTWSRSHRAAIRTGLHDAAFVANLDDFRALAARLAERVAYDGLYRARIRDKRRRRALDERAKPLEAYRDEELARRHECFFGPGHTYHEARRRFVYKLGGASADPPRLARPTAIRRAVQCRRDRELSDPISILSAHRQQTPPKEGAWN